ncbi:site-specific DNA-methyltransferase [Clostridioides difficile]|nr:site-specific DNA-methyltransferase [Clostridioides difficile]NJK16015.1 site-specific DNA-methyltransferase [Clostridioides difficile]
MTELSGQTLDILAKNIEEIKYLFPDAFTENKIDFDKLKQILGEYVNDNVERYNFSWNGKGKALRLAQSPSTGTLRPDKEESVDWDNTKNLYIEGDNLEVLKLLQKSYYGKIKMIYIDPPYNTGKDFVYPDNYKDNLENYLHVTGQYGENGSKISTNTETNGRYHTNWLNMMYPRLRLARNLLSDEGVIFISIDDIEAANLKKICCEIFGEDNFVADLIWQKKFSRSNDATYFSTMHDHIFCFCKLNIKTSKNGWKLGLLPRGSEIPDGYSNPDNDYRGVWTSVVLSAKSGSEKLIYDIITPSGRVCIPPSGRFWSVNKEKFDELVKENRIWFGAKGDSIPRLKTFLSEVQDGLRPNTIWFHNEVGHNQEGKQETKEIFDGVGVFDSPKPVRLLKYMLKIANLNSTDLVLDFFSGSSTTAHAVMQLNVEDNKNCRFIMVQFPECTDEKDEAYKVGYKNICEIGKERIRRVGINIKKEVNLLDKNIDVGFRVFKLDTSNIRKWQPNCEDLEQSLINYIDNYVEGRSDIDVIYEIMLKMGLDLNYLVKENYIEGKKVYCIEQGKLIVCLDGYITTTIAEGITKLYNKQQLRSWKIVFKDNGFVNDSIKANVCEILKCAGLDDDSFITL